VSNEAPVKRRLAAILAADVVGYSRLMAADEEATIRTLDAYRPIISDLISEHAGRIFGAAGDSVICASKPDTLDLRKQIGGTIDEYLIEERSRVELAAAFANCDVPNRELRAFILKTITRHVV
jgi:class 3 adenylate cyclase